MAEKIALAIAGAKGGTPGSPTPLHLYRAESEGFEPSIPFRVYTLSRRAPSTTRTTLHFNGLQKYTVIA